MTKRDDCREWLLKHLAGGMRVVSEVKAEGAKQGFGRGTVERAASDLGIHPTRVGRINYWSLPPFIAQNPEDVEEVPLSTPAPPEGASEKEQLGWLEANRGALENAIRRHRAVLANVAHDLGFHSLTLLERFIFEDEKLRVLYAETWRRNTDTMLHAALNKALKGDRSMQQFFIRGSYDPLANGHQEEEEEMVDVVLTVIVDDGSGDVSSSGSSICFSVPADSPLARPPRKKEIFIDVHANDDPQVGELTPTAEETPSISEESAGEDGSIQ